VHPEKYFADDPMRGLGGNVRVDESALAGMASISAMTGHGDCVIRVFKKAAIGSEAPVHEAIRAAGLLFIGPHPPVRRPGCRQPRPTGMPLFQRNRLFGLDERVRRVAVRGGHRADISDFRPGRESSTMAGIV